MNAWLIGLLNAFLVFVLSYVAIRAFFVVQVGSWARGFDERFPPISDEEFLLRCSPGTNPEIALKVRSIVSEQLGIPKSQIYPEQNFLRDLDCN